MARILIVDDQAVNREILRAYLDDSGHQLFEADSGDGAIRKFSEVHPDIVLLDVMMPGVNGFAATERIKQIAGEVFVPVILVSALSDPTSRMLGLRVGADEFLTKPVDRHELTVRVRNLLELRSKARALNQKNLEHLELHRFKDDMVAMIVHDLKNPLSAVLANIQYVLDESPELLPETREVLGEANEASLRILRLLANLTDVARVESAALQLTSTSVCPSELLHPLLHQRSALAASREITVVATVDPAARVSVDPDMFARVVENLCDNAFRHTPRGGRVELRVVSEGGRVRISVGNTGPAIPREVQAILFQKFAQAPGASGRLNLGLGLYFCRLAVEAHAGTISVGETAELPTVFTIDLPSGSVE